MSVSNAARLRAPLFLATDRQIATLAARGEARAFAALYERYHQELYRYCHSILGNGEDALDALQNTMTRALRALPGEEREIALRPWLYRVAHNEAISLLRERRPNAELDEASQLQSPGIEQQTSIRTELRQLTADLGQLAERQRSALVMRELSGLGYGEIAAALGTTEAAAKQTVYEARVALRALAQGREMDCEAVQRSISDGDRRLLRAGRVRSHLRSCADCRAFNDAIAARQAQLAALAPPLSVIGAASLLQGLLGGGAQASAGGGGGLLAGLFGGGAANVAAGSAAKVALVGAITVGAGVEVATTTDLVGGGQQQRGVRAPAVTGPAAPSGETTLQGTLDARGAATSAPGDRGQSEPGGAEAAVAAVSIHPAGEPQERGVGPQRETAASMEADHPSPPAHSSASGNGHSSTSHPGRGPKGDDDPAAPGRSEAAPGHLKPLSAPPGRLMPEESWEPPGKVQGTRTSSHRGRLALTSSPGLR